MSILCRLEHQFGPLILGVDWDSVMNSGTLYLDSVFSDGVDFDSDLFFFLDVVDLELALAWEFLDSTITGVDGKDDVQNAVSEQKETCVGELESINLQVKEYKELLIEYSGKICLVDLKEKLLVGRNVN